MAHNKFAVIFMLTVGCGGESFSSGFNPSPGLETDGGHNASGGATATETDGGSSTGAGGKIEHAHGGSGTGGAREGSGGASTGGSSDGGTITCLTDLSGVGTGDFSIRFTLATTTVPAADTYMALLNQRSSCDNTRPGWDVWMTAQGNLGVEVYDGGGSAYVNVTDSRAINDGALHRVTVARSGASLSVGIDGVFNTYPSQPIMSLATLSPMNVGIDPTCTGVRNVSGRLIDVCITTGAWR